MPVRGWAAQTPLILAHAERASCPLEVTVFGGSVEFALVEGNAARKVDINEGMSTQEWMQERFSVGEKEAQPRRL